MPALDDLTRQHYLFHDQVYTTETVVRFVGHVMATCPSVQKLYLSRTIVTDYVTSILISDNQTLHVRKPSFSWVIVITACLDTPIIEPPQASPMGVPAQPGGLGNNKNYYRSKLSKIKLNKVNIFKGVIPRMLLIISTMWLSAPIGEDWGVKVLQLHQIPIRQPLMDKGRRKIKIESKYLE